MKNKISHIKDFSRKVSDIESRFTLENKESIKKEINLLFQNCKNYEGESKEKFRLYMLIHQALNNYVVYYRCIQTGNEVIDFLENDPFVNNHKYKNVFNFYYIHAYANHIRWICCVELRNTSTYKTSYYRQNLTYLLKAKKSLLKIYKEDFTKNLNIKKGQRYSYLSLLISTLGELYRFSEIFKILEKFSTAVGSSTFSASLEVQTLIRLKNDTCLSYNPKLNEKIVQKYNLFSQSNEFDTFLNSKVFKNSINQMENEYGKCLKYLENENVQSFLKKHSLKEDNICIKPLNKYQIFCHYNRLFLNEHTFYCNCNLSLKDELKIESNHSHTKIDWAKKYEIILNVLIKTFAFARLNYFKSLDDIILNSNINDDTLCEDDLKKEHLKSAFGECYRILDKIALTILDALDIDYKNILKEQGINSNVYFLNLWDFDVLFDKEFVEINPYLMTLYSIAKDLDKDKKISAFAKFRGVRNAIEHKIFLITEKTKKKENDIVYITKKELSDYCLILLDLTKSAIFSFAYFIRKESISKAEEVNYEHY